MNRTSSAISGSAVTQKKPAARAMSTTARPLSAAIKTPTLKSILDKPVRSTLSRNHNANSQTLKTAKASNVRLKQLKDANGPSPYEDGATSNSEATGRTFERKRASSSYMSATITSKRKMSTQPDDDAWPPVNLRQPMTTKAIDAQTKLSNMLISGTKSSKDIGKNGLQDIEERSNSRSVSRNP